LLFIFARKKLSIGYLIAALIALSFATNVIIVAHSTAAAFYSPASRFWELMCGAALAYWAADGRGWSPSNRLVLEVEALFGLICIIGASFFFTSDLSFPGWWATIPVLGSCCLIHAGPASLLNKRVLSSRPLVWLGLISYALYLWHWPLLSLAYLRGGGTPGEGVRIVLVLTAIALAVITYLLVERPIRFWSGYNRTKVAGLCSATIGLVALGLYVFAEEGRVTAHQRALKIRYIEMKDDWRGGQCLMVRTMAGRSVRPPASITSIDASSPAIGRSLSSGEIPSQPIFTPV
jgi:peptidoglycan/LPS O-acetylase OafA/YrhL